MHGFENSHMSMHSYVIATLQPDLIHSYNFIIDTVSSIGKYVIGLHTWKSLQKIKREACLITSLS